MIRFPKKSDKVSTETLVNTIWVSAFMGMIFTIPPLGVFLGLYFGTGELLVAVILGFGLHFIILAFSDRISKTLTEIMH